MADNEDVGRAVDTEAVAELWAAHGSRLTAQRRVQIVDAVKRRIAGDDDGETDIDFVLDEADALRDALRTHVDAVLPADQLVEARLRIGIAVADLVARAASRRLATLEATALIDPLTGLGNRRAAAGAFEAALASAQRHDTPVAVALVDVVGLKRLNDEQGHAAGDAALVALADALRRSMRADDSAYRFGGDEFVVLAPISTATDLARLFDRVRADAPDFTVGIAEAPRDGMTQDVLVATADARMYAQRQGGAIAPTGHAVSTRRLATIGAAALAVLLALVGPVLAWTSQPGDRGGRAIDASSTTVSTATTTTTTTTTPPSAVGFVGAAGSAEPAPAIVTQVPRAAVVTPSTAPTTAAAPTTTTTVADELAAASRRGRGRKPDKVDKPAKERNPRAAERLDER